ncbi:MAG: TauD/TfdA family dioxygenase [Acidobacteriota bacterium]
MQRRSLKDLRSGQRNALSVSSADLITAEPLNGGALPLVVQPSSEGLNLAVWAAHNRGLIEDYLAKYGAILFRGFRLEDVMEFEWFIESVSAKLLEYKERSSPRSLVSGRIYTSTEYSPSQSIFPHNENSYQLHWPTKIFFFCLEPANQGGETPIVDTRRVFQRLAPELRERFIEKQVKYVRNYGVEFGLRWSFVFQTTDKQAVEDYCRQNDIRYEWRDSDGLRTEAIRPAVVRHPRTGEWSWFNHATFFHYSTLDPLMREVLSELGEDNLPNNTYYGDGTRIEPDILDELRAAYREETVSFTWQAGDVLMLDNLLVAHSRTPYSGARKVVVGMADPLSWNSVH